MQLKMNKNGHQYHVKYVHDRAKYNLTQKLQELVKDITNVIYMKKNIFLEQKKQELYIKNRNNQPT